MTDTPEAKYDCANGKHHMEIDGYPYTIDDPKMIGGKRRVADYRCRLCGATETVDYQDYQEDWTE